MPNLPQEDDNELNTGIDQDVEDDALESEEHIQDADEVQQEMDEQSEKK